MRKFGSKHRYIMRCPTLGLSFFLLVSAVALSTSTPTVDSQSRSTPEVKPNPTADITDLPAKLCDEARALSTQQRREPNQSAVQKYQEAARLWQDARDYSRAANALTNAGELLVILGELRLALNTFTESLMISKTAKSRLEETRSLNGLAYVYFLQGNSRAAEEKSTRALDLAKQIRDRELEARALSNLAESIYGSGDLQNAKKHQQDAFEIWKSLGNRQGQTLAQVALAYYNCNLSEPHLALNYLENALQSAQQIGDIRGQVLALNAMGNVKAKLNRKQEALEAYERAKPLAEEIGDQLSLAMILGGTASLYHWMGDFQRAIAYDEQAVKAFDAIGALWGSAEAKLDLGRTQNAIGNHEPAIAYLTEALELFRSMGMRRLEARTQSEIAVVLTSKGEYRKSIETLQQSMRLNLIGQDYRFEAYTLNLMGMDYERLNEKEQAVKNYQRALEMSRIASDHAAESNSLFNIARIQRDRGDLMTAEENLRTALAIAESVRTTVSSHDLRASYFASVRQLYELYIDVLMLQHRNHPERGFDERAFAVSERARARSLLESLQEGQANIREGVDATLLEKERSLSEMLNARADRHMQLVGKKDLVEADKVQKEIDQLAEEHERVRDQIRTSSPRYAALTSPQPVDLKQVQQRLVDDESVLLEYALGDDHSYVWVITKQGLSTFELAPRKEIEDAARKLYADFVAYQMNAGDTVQEHAERQKKADNSLPFDTAKLSQLILSPVAGHLSNKRLIIVTDGALQYIPFPALNDPDSEPQAPQYLYRQHEIVIEPSASTLALLLNEATQRSPASDSVAVFADPVFEVDDPRVKRASYESTPESSESLRVKQALRDIGISADGIQIPRLLASSEEAEAIINSAPWGTGMKAVGFEASRSRVLDQELGRYRVVHFATHGLVNNYHPELSGIVLSLFDQEGRSQDGFLRLHDIYNLHLPADLVVLSACSTGLGKDVRGEGLIGLTRGFMYAGASGVVASLWKVDDRATAELMKLFYEGIFEKGLPPVAALRDAQMQMSQQKTWRSPYYWAGFIIQGRYDEQLSSSRVTYMTGRRIATVAVLISVGIIGTFLVIRGRRRRVI